MSIAWIATLVLCFGFANAQVPVKLDISKVFEKQMQLLDAIKPEVETSCVISRPNDPLDLFIMCPTEVDCYAKAYTKRTMMWYTALSPLNTDATCEAIDLEALPVSKWRQLDAVLQFLKLSNNESTCELSSIETLIVPGCGLVDAGRLGGANCRVDNASGDVSDCSYKLKHLKLSHNKIESLLNHSFCQYKQLEYLELTKCGLKHVEADAFVDLVHLKDIALDQNQLTHLPVDLFQNNLHLQVVDLSYNQLQSQVLNVLASIESLQHLSMSFNRITFVDDRFTFPSKLIRLYMNSNLIQKIGLELSHLTHLTQLGIFNCSVSRVHEKAFQNLTSVTFINLQNNSLEQLHEDTFKNNLKLEELILNHNKLRDFPRVGHLANLKELKLNNNRISSVRKTSLINCTQLSRLHLAFNKLSFIEKGSVDKITQLEHLDLYHNHLNEITADFKNSNILILDLGSNNFTTFTYEIVPPNVTTLFLSENGIETIKPYNFIGQRGREWKLTELDLSDNQIRTIENLKLPPSIQKINLRFNKISQIFSLDDVKAQNLLELQSVNVRDNSISTLCQASFQLYSLNLKVKYSISGNPLTCTCDNMWLRSPWTYSMYVTIADLSDVTCQMLFPYKNFDTKTQLSQLVLDRFLCPSDHVNTNRCKCPPMDDLRCEVPCPTDCTCLSDPLLTTVYFICFGRHLTRIPGGINGSHIFDNVTTVIDLNNNIISHVGVNDFDDLPPKIMYLHMENSKIRSIAKNAFDKLINLTVLSLAYNPLEVFPNGLFHKLTQLTHLNLSNNHLMQLADDTFSSLINLKYLHLHNNSLSQLQLGQFAQLNSLENISLHNNPWSCDCNFIKPFRQFLLNSSKKVDDKLPLNCTENGEQFNINTMNIDHCTTQIQLTILVITLTFATILILTIGLVFKWRYELQVLIYSRYGLRMFHKRQPEEDVNDKQFDAFLAYNSEDSEFLVQQLLPGLEEIDRPYRTCIHERDFLAGGFIQDNILEAVRLSSRTIILLSENFVNSGWCRFEFKTAHVQMLQDRCPRVLVIVLGEIPGTLDPEMQLYLKTNTYLKWGEKLFWQKLYFALPDQRVTNSIPTQEL